jgi:DNA-binding beta-propeller fold protein YncE
MRRMRNAVLSVACSLLWLLQPPYLGADSTGSFGGFGKAGDIAIDSQGRIYVTDLLKHIVVRFDSMQGDNAVVFGQFGKGQGQFRQPFGLAIDSSDKIYILDQQDNRLVRIV